MARAGGDDRDTRLMNEFAAMPFSQFATQRLFVTGGGGGEPPGCVYHSTSAVAHTAPAHLGSWWAERSALDMCEELDDALDADDDMRPASGAVEDLLHFTPGLDAADRRIVNGIPVNTILRRRTAFVTGSGAASQPDEWTEGDTSQKPSALLLTHRFDAALPNDTLVLRTLFMDDRVFEATPERMLRDVFGKRVPALSPTSLRCEHHHGLTTDVLINGAPLSAADLSVLPKTHREAIAAARSAQLLTTLHDCITQHWVGGFLALRHFAAELLGVQARLYTEMLASQLIFLRACWTPDDDGPAAFVQHAVARFSQRRALRPGCRAATQKPGARCLNATRAQMPAYPRRHVERTGRR